MFFLIRFCKRVTSRGPTVAGWVLALLIAFPAVAQETSPSDGDGTDVVAEPAEEVAPLDPDEVQRQIEQLSSKEFAKRERAAMALAEMGVQVVPMLRELAQQTDDAEVRLRATEIVRGLTQGDLQTRIDDFLAGREVSFTGWLVFQAMVGDSVGVRTLFIDLMQSHPELLESLEGTTRDRVVALEKVLATIQHRMFVEREFPTQADTFAILLPVADGNVPVTAGYESAVLAILMKKSASEIRQDAQLSRPFRALLGRWMIRSLPENRLEVLLAGMRWDIEETLSLGLQTLSDGTLDTETLATALQAISRFGIREHAQKVAPLLDDDRPASETGYSRGKLIRTELRDVAMVTIAILQGADMTELGLGDLRKDPKFGFVVGDVGFAVDGNSKERQKLREKIDALLARDVDSETEGS